ncbi:hypothetical protein P8C59_005940 [Phyllachora maydis]|uniref:Uncharacterized protein n=1 Tax=Phyllachora maydis TaxID=1825666 RepID=A0AAD9I6N5_9PEZI|nr:hypothetical protein P8C59_005940 [Phyllachora maydis]
MKNLDSLTKQSIVFLAGQPLLLAQHASVGHARATCSYIERLVAHSAHNIRSRSARTALPAELWLIIMAMLRADLATQAAAAQVRPEPGRPTDWRDACLMVPRRRLLLGPSARRPAATLLPPLPCATPDPPFQTFRILRGLRVRVRPSQRTARFGSLKNRAHIEALDAALLQRHDLGGSTTARPGNVQQQQQQQQQQLVIEPWSDVPGAALLEFVVAVGSRACASDRLFHSIRVADVVSTVEGRRCGVCGGMRAVGTSWNRAVTSTYMLKGQRLDCPLCKGLEQHDAHVNLVASSSSARRKRSLDYHMAVFRGRWSQ